MGIQHIDFKQGVDTGDNTADSIQPIQDGENATGAVFQRPSENLRQRTEIIRAAVEEIRYLTDADRAFLLTGGGTVRWNGVVSGGGDGKFTATASFALRPFLAPPSSTPAIVNVNGVDVRATTVVTGGVNPARAYGQLGNLNHPGANRISVEAVNGGALSVAVSGAPGPRHVTLTFTQGTHTLQDVVNYLTVNTDAGPVAFRALGLTAALHAGASGATLLTAFGSTYLQGAADAEVHLLSSATLATFFADGNNLMQEGDTLAIWYDALVDATAGGRRQSLNEAPESSPDVPAASLFLVRRFPERIPYALPLARVVNDELIFINGKRHVKGVDGASIDASSFDLPTTGHVQVGSQNTRGARVDAAGDEGRVVLGKTGESDAVLTKTKLDSLIGGPTNADTLHGHGAAAVAFVPAGNIAATTVDGALKELDQEKSAVGHTHPKSQITDFAHTHPKADVTDFAHTHAQSEVTGLTTALAGKSDTTHDHAGVYGPIIPWVRVRAVEGVPSITAQSGGFSVTLGPLNNYRVAHASITANARVIVQKEGAFDPIPFTGTDGFVDVGAPLTGTINFMFYVMGF